MTTVFFVRHAEPNYENHDDASRELSNKGLVDRRLVTGFLMDKQIDIVLSSPYKRAIDTVRDFAEAKGMGITIIDEFKERRVDSGWIEDFNSFCRKQWAEFSYKLSDGECLEEVQNRNVLALNRVLEKYRGKNIVVGSHGTALSTIINYYDKTFGYSDFDKIRNLMPWVVQFTFEGKKCVNIQQYNLFEIFASNHFWDFGRENMRTNKIDTIVNLSEEQKKIIMDEIAYFFHSELEEEIGILKQGQILDLFVEQLAPIVYNKALDDAMRWYKHQQDNMEADYYSLYKEVR